MSSFAFLVLLLAFVWSGMMLQGLVRDRFEVMVRHFVFQLYIAAGRSGLVPGKKLLT